jgi:serine/threonine protein kinase
LIVTRYAERGSLFKVLHNETLEDLPLDIKIKLTMDIAEGLQYLHTHHIVHRDMKSLNILVTEDWTALISDFGDARVMDSYMTIGIGTYLFDLSMRLY